jgi:hypothetical protein
MQSRGKRIAFVGLLGAALAAWGMPKAAFAQPTAADLSGNYIFSFHGTDGQPSATPGALNGTGWLTFDGKGDIVGGNITYNDTYNPADSSSEAGAADSGVCTAALTAGTGGASCATGSCYTVTAVGTAGNVDVTLTLNATAQGTAEGSESAAPTAPEYDDCPITVLNLRGALDRAVFDPALIYFASTGATELGVFTNFVSVTGTFNKD